MRISHIGVHGLFGRFNHDITFPAGEPITIMIGPNGFGKTMILRMVNALFNQPARSLARFPFREFVIDFDGDAQVTARRTEQVEGTSKRASVEFTCKRSGHPDHVFKPEPMSPADLDVPIGMIEEIVPELDQTGSAEWRSRRTGEMFGLEEVFDRFGELLPASSKVAGSRTPDWLRATREAISVRFIDTERLMQAVDRDPRLSRKRFVHGAGPSVQGRTIRKYSEELAEQVRQTLAEYGTLSQQLDRTFPARLVNEPAQPRMSLDSLRDELSAVESKRSQLVHAGLLAQDQHYWGVGVPTLDAVDESRWNVLAVYAADARQKLGVFDGLYQRVTTLTSIANSRLLHKRVTIGAAGLTVKATDGRELELEMLSSGEQHELVILYELLFKTNRNSLILIDEPELSLHIDWQEEFLNDLMQIAKLSDFRVLLATHSPQIVGDRWDLAVQLKA